MNLKHSSTVFIVLCALIVGCGVETSSQPAPTDTDLAVDTRPKFDGVLSHTFTNGRRLSMDSPPASTSDFEGLEHYKFTRKDDDDRPVVEIEVEFEFREHKNGKDVYSVIKTVSETTYDASGNSETGSHSYGLRIEYDGTPITIGDTWAGVTRLISRERDAAERKQNDATSAPKSP